MVEGWKRENEEPPTYVKAKVFVSHRKDNGTALKSHNKLDNGR